MAGFATIAALDEHSFVYGCLHPTASAAPHRRQHRRSDGAVPEKLVNECKKAGEAVAAAKKSEPPRMKFNAKVDKLLALKKQITMLSTPITLTAIVDKRRRPRQQQRQKRRRASRSANRSASRAARTSRRRRKDKDPNRWAVDPPKRQQKRKKRA